MAIGEPTVLAIILNYKTYEMSLEMVEKLKCLNYVNLDILIVDNCSPNESKQILEQEAQKGAFKFIENSTNAGYAAGNNVGIRCAIEKGYKYSWLINNDLVFTDLNVLKKMVSEAEKNDLIACVGPRITDSNGYVVAPFINRPTRWSQTFGIFTERKKRERQKNTAQLVYKVYGCCMLLKNEAMKKIDCLDERTFLFCEEEILAERLRGINNQVYYCADANITHLESMTVNSEYGKQSGEKRNQVMRSMDIYLRDYLHYGLVSRLMCEGVRGMIMMLRK